MKKIVLPIVCLFLSACSADDVDEPAETIGAEIAEDYNEMLDKAGDVENQLLEQKENMDDALDEAESRLPQR